MMYPYLTFGDGTEVVHSHLIENGNEKSVVVHFERPSENGFDDARCVLPEYSWSDVVGFSDEEIETFRQFLESNAHLIFKYAAEGGIKIA